MNGTPAASAVAAIIEDLTDRSGLGNEWEAIDEETRIEIQTTWIQAVQDTHASLRNSHDALLAALKRLMNQPTMSPLKMTPEQRKDLWAAHALARLAISAAEGSRPAIEDMLAAVPLASASPPEGTPE